MPATKTDVPAAPKSASDFAAPAPRVSPYRVAAKSPRVPCGKGQLARGVRVARKDTEKDTPVLLYLNGDSITPASTLAQIGAAITHGLITPAEIAYLQNLGK